MNDKSKVSGGPEIHPGEILREMWLAELQMSSADLAVALGVTTATIEDLVRGRSPITPELACRLARYFETSVDLWCNLQRFYDLARLRNDNEFQEALNRITPRG